MILSAQKRTYSLTEHINSDMLHNTALGAILPVLELEKAQVLSVKKSAQNQIARFELPSPQFSALLSGRVDPQPGAHLLTQNLGISVFDMVIDRYGMPLAIFPMDRGVAFKKFSALPYWDLSILSLPATAFYSCSSQKKQAVAELWQERAENRLQALKDYSSEMDVEIVTPYNLTDPVHLAHHNLPYSSTLQLCFSVNALSEPDSGSAALMSVLDPVSINGQYLPPELQGKFIMPFAPTVYRPLMGYDYGFYNEIIKATHQLCKHKESLRILDIACGSGMIPAIVSEIARHHGKSVEIYAYDLNPIAAAQSNYFLNTVLGQKATVCQAGSPDEALTKMAASAESFDLMTVNAPMPQKFSNKPRTLIDLHDCHSDAVRFHDNLIKLGNNLNQDGQILLWSSTSKKSDIKDLKMQRLNSYGGTCSTYKFEHA